MIFFCWLRQNVKRGFPELRCSLSKPLTISYFLLLVEKVHVIFLLVEKVHVRSRDLPKTRLRILPLSREFKILSPRIHLCFFSKRKNKGEMRRRPVKWKSDKNWWNFTGNRPFFMGIQSEIWPFQIPSKPQLLGGFQKSSRDFGRSLVRITTTTSPPLLLQQPQNEPKNENVRIRVADFFLQRA